MVLALAVKSLRNRKLSAGLTLLSIALAVMLLLGVERLRQESRTSFASAVSGTDLIVGARGSPVHLLLSSVFHIGNPTNNIRWDTYRAIAQRPEVAWTIPISLGDSHRGFRVLGTTPAFFEHFRFGSARKLGLAQGKALDGAHDAVLGADVAEALGYWPGPIRRRGTWCRRGELLAAPGPAVSRRRNPFPHRHTGRSHGVRYAGGNRRNPRQGHQRARRRSAYSGAARAATDEHGAGEADSAAHAPSAITAFLVGLKSRPAALGMQRAINEYAGEPLTAILPGVTLQEVWEITGAAERTLFAVSALVVVVGLAGMLVALLTSLSERRREMAILRSVGARPAHVFALILGEAAFLTVLGIVLGAIALYAGLVDRSILAGIPPGAVYCGKLAVRSRTGADGAGRGRRCADRADPCLAHLPVLAGRRHDHPPVTLSLEG